MNFREYLKDGESIEFEILGYFIEFMSGDTYLGSINIDEPEDREIGYYGREDYVATENIHLDRGKIIKKGTQYHTRMYPICGKWLNKPTLFERRRNK